MWNCNKKKCLVADLHYSPTSPSTTCTVLLQTSGNSFWCSLTTCIMNCVCSSVFNRSPLYSCISATPLSALSHEYDDDMPNAAGCTPSSAETRCGRHSPNPNLPPLQTLLLPLFAPVFFCQNTPVWHSYSAADEHAGWKIGWWWTYQAVYQKHVAQQRLHTAWRSLVLIRYWADAWKMDLNCSSSCELFLRCLAL